MIISNCVINLSPDKASVFREAFRALKQGGRIAISDVVAIAPIPASMRARIEAMTGCLAGASAVVDLERLLEEAGFTNVRVTPKPESRAFISQWTPGAEDVIASATIEATKGPAKACCGPACCT